MLRKIAVPVLATLLTITLITSIAFNLYFIKSQNKIQVVISDQEIKNIIEEQSQSATHSQVFTPTPILFLSPTLTTTPLPNSTSKTPKERCETDERGRTKCLIVE